MLSQKHTVNAKSMSFNQKQFQNYFLIMRLLNFTSKIPGNSFLYQFRDVNSGAQKNLSLENYKANPSICPKKAELKGMGLPGLQRDKRGRKMSEGGPFSKISPLPPATLGDKKGCLTKLFRKAINFGLPGKLTRTKKKQKNKRKQKGLLSKSQRRKERKEGL